MIMPNGLSAYKRQMGTDRKVKIDGKKYTPEEAMTGLILLCGVQACRSNLCELEKHTMDPTTSNPFERDG